MEREVGKARLGIGMWMLAGWEVTQILAFPYTGSLGSKERQMLRKAFQKSVSFSGN